VKHLTSQTWKSLYPVAAASENANKDNSGGSSDNGILGEEEEEEVEKEEDEVYCQCQRMPVSAYMANRLNLMFSVRAVAE
jgi:hypothetical protein